LPELPDASIETRNPIAAPPTLRARMMLGRAAVFPSLANCGTPVN